MEQITYSQVAPIYSIFDIHQEMENYLLNEYDFLIEEIEESPFEQAIKKLGNYLIHKND